MSPQYVFFFFIIFIYLLTTYTLTTVPRSNEKGPKRRVVDASLAPHLCPSLPPSTTTLPLSPSALGERDKYTNNTQEHTKRAQTTNEVRRLCPRLETHLRCVSSLVAMSKKTQTTQDVVWVICTCFFLFFHIYSILTNIHSFYLRFEGKRRVRTMKWAQTTCLASFGPQVCVFFFKNCVFYILTNDLCYIQIPPTFPRHEEGSGNENGPKRCVWHIIWAISTCFFFFFSCFFILTNIFRFYLHYEGMIRDRGGQGQRKQAQTMPDTSFGPQVRVFFF